MVEQCEEDGGRQACRYSASRRGSMTSIPTSSRPSSSRRFSRQMSLPDRLNQPPIQFRLVQRRMRRISLTNEVVPSHVLLEFVDPTQKENQGLKRRNLSRKTCQGNFRWANSCSSSSTNSTGSCSSVHRCESVDGDCESRSGSEGSASVIKLPPVVCHHRREPLDSSPSCSNQAPKRPQRKYSEGSDTLDTVTGDGIGKGIPRWIIINHDTNTVSIEMSCCDHHSEPAPLSSAHPSLSDSAQSSMKDSAAKLPPKMPRRASQEDVVTSLGQHHACHPKQDCPILEKKSLLADFFNYAGDDILDDLSNRSFRDWDEEDNLDESCWAKSTTNTSGSSSRRRGSSIDSPAAGTARRRSSIDSDVADRIIGNILEAAKDEKSAAKKVMATYWDWIATSPTVVESEDASPPMLSACESRRGSTAPAAARHKKREQLLYGY